MKVLIILFVFFLFSCSADRTHADLVLTNGKIYSLHRWNLSTWRMIKHGPKTGKVPKGLKGLIRGEP